MCASSRYALSRHSESRFLSGEQAKLKCNPDLLCLSSQITVPLAIINGRDSISQRPPHSLTDQHGARCPNSHSFGANVDRLALKLRARTGPDRNGQFNRQPEIPPAILKHEAIACPQYTCNLRRDQRSLYDETSSMRSHSLLGWVVGRNRKHDGASIRSALAKVLDEGDTLKNPIQVDSDVLELGLKKALASGGVVRTPVKPIGNRKENFRQPPAPLLRIRRPPGPRSLAGRNRAKIKFFSIIRLLIRPFQVLDSPNY
jgi:hypothetical protein